MNRAMAGFVAVLLMGSRASAGLIAVDFDTGYSVYGNGSKIYGFEFEANSAVSVTALGNLDATGSGFSQPQQVGLWDLDGNLLASTFVDNSDPLVNDKWRFHEITPVTLTSGQSYIVGGQGGADFTAFINTPYVDPRITFVQDRHGYVGSFSNDPLFFPNESDNRGLNEASYFGANFQLAAVPEPGSLVLFGFAAVWGGLAARRRRIAAPLPSVS